MEKVKEFVKLKNSVSELANYNKLIYLYKIGYIDSSVIDTIVDKLNPYQMEELKKAYLFKVQDVKQRNVDLPNGVFITEQDILDLYSNMKILSGISYWYNLKYIQIPDSIFFMLGSEKYKEFCEFAIKKNVRFVLKSDTRTRNVKSIRSCKEILKNILNILSKDIFSTSLHGVYSKCKFIEDTSLTTIESEELTREECEKLYQYGLEIQDIFYDLENEDDKNFLRGVYESNDYDNLYFPEGLYDLKNKEDRKIILNKYFFRLINVKLGVKKGFAFDYNKIDENEFFTKLIVNHPEFLDEIIEMAEEKYKEEFDDFDINSITYMDPEFNESLRLILPQINATVLGSKTFQKTLLRKSNFIFEKIVSDLYDSGELKKLTDNTAQKVNYNGNAPSLGINDLLDEKIDFPPKRLDGKIDYKRVRDILLSQVIIKEKDLSDDKILAEKLWFQRNILNKYTKGIEDVEKNMLAMYTNANFDELTQKLLVDKKNYIEILKISDYKEKIISDVYKIVKKNPSDRGRKNILLNNIKAFYTDYNQLSQEKIEELVRYAEGGLEKEFKETYANLMYKQIQNYGKFEAESKGTKCNANERCYKGLSDEVNKEFNKRITSMHRLYEFYKGLKTGEGNTNSYPEFSEIIREYLEAKESRNLKHFRKKYKSLPNGYEFCRELHSTIKDLNTISFNVKDRNKLYCDIAKFLTIKDRIYSLKHLSSIQLINTRDDRMLFLNMQDSIGQAEGVLDVMIDGYCELSGGHYNSSEVEAKVPFEEVDENMRQDLNQTMSIEGNGLNRAYILLPKLSEKQVKEFQKLAEYIYVLEGKKIIDDLSDVDESKFTYLENLRNSSSELEQKRYLSLKTVILTGAGKEVFKDFYNFQGKEIESQESKLEKLEEKVKQKDDQIQSQETTIQEKDSEIERLRKELERYKVLEESQKRPSAADVDHILTEEEKANAARKGMQIKEALTGQTQKKQGGEAYGD